METEADAEDIVQDVFIVVGKKRYSVARRKGDKTYLSILSETLFDKIEKRCHALPHRHIIKKLLTRKPSRLTKTF
ncbi:MAG: hypothetical protein ACLUDU_10795 [Butyricimonas faecihominis]